MPHLQLKPWLMCLFLALGQSLLAQPVPSGRTFTAEKGAADQWSHLAVTIGNLADLKTTDRQGWRNNGTSFSSKAAGGGVVPVSISLTGKKGVSYADYTFKVTASASGAGGTLLQQTGTLSKDGGNRTFSCTWDPVKNPGSLNVRVEITGGNPDFFTYFVSGSVDAPPKPAAPTAPPPQPPKPVMATPAPAPLPPQATTPKEEVDIHLTFPNGKSRKVFTAGWTFGATAILTSGSQKTDISSQVRWTGTGTFSPEVGSISHPTFQGEGRNTITLTVTVHGKSYTHNFSGDAVDPRRYAAVGDAVHCPADAHGCPSCPHAVTGSIRTGSSTVLIGGRPAARVGDGGVHASCCGPNTFTITSGDPDLLIDGKPAARKGDKTKHCGGVGTIVVSGTGMVPPRLH